MQTWTRPDSSPPVDNESSSTVGPMSIDAVCQHWGFHHLPLSREMIDHVGLLSTPPIASATAAVHDAVRRRRPLDLAAPPGWGTTTLLRALSHSAGFGLTPVRALYVGPASDRDAARRWLSESSSDVVSVLFRDRDSPVLRVPSEISTVVSAVGAIRPLRSTTSVKLRSLSELEAIKLLERGLVAAGGRPEMLSGGMAGRLARLAAGSVSGLALHLRAALTRAAERSSAVVQDRDTHSVPLTTRYAA